MNKGSKLQAGWHSIHKNERLLLVHSRNVNNVARICDVYRSPAKRKLKHKESAPKRMKLDEQCALSDESD